MKRALLVMSVLIIMIIGAPVFAQNGVTVVCESAPCGCNGGGLAVFRYEVAASAGEMIKEFLVGTDDNLNTNYWNWQMPAGWTAVILPIYVNHNGLTPKGGISIPQGVPCLYSIVFTGPPVTNAMFAFDHLWVAGGAHDVGWQVITDKNIYVEDWSAPVGMGAGPVHGPIQTGQH